MDLEKEFRDVISHGSVGMVSQACVASLPKSTLSTWYSTINLLYLLWWMKLHFV